MAKLEREQQFTAAAKLLGVERDILVLGRFREKPVSTNENREAARKLDKALRKVEYLLEKNNNLEPRLQKLISTATIKAWREVCREHFLDKEGVKLFGSAGRPLKKGKRGAAEHAWRWMRRVGLEPSGQLYYDLAAIIYGDPEENMKRACDDVRKQSA